MTPSSLLAPLLVPAFIALLPAPTEAQCVSGFSFSDAVDIFEAPCSVHMRTPISAQWARAEWQQSLPQQFVFEVDIQRPVTDTGCDTSGFLIGGTSDAVAGTPTGIRVLAMSTDGYGLCTSGAISYINPGRLVVEPASNPSLNVGSEWIIENVPSWDFSNPIRVRIEYDGVLVSVFSDGAYLGSFPFTFAERKLTLVAFDQDDPTHYDNMTVNPFAQGTPASYGTAKPSSSSCVTQIGTSDMSSQPVSGDSDYFVTATGVEGLKNGLVFAAMAGPAAIPFSGGILSLQPPLRRGPILFSGGSSGQCDGTFSTLVNDGNIMPFGLDGGPGGAVYYQYWGRDPQNGPGSLGTFLSNAMQLHFQ